MKELKWKEKFLAENDGIKIKAKVLH